MPLNVRTHESGGVSSVSPDFSINLDNTLLDDRNNFLSGQSVLQPVPEEDREGERFAKLMGTRRRTGSLISYK